MNSITMINIKPKYITKTFKYFVNKYYMLLSILGQLFDTIVIKGFFVLKKSILITYWIGSKLYTYNYYPIEEKIKLEDLQNELKILQDKLNRYTDNPPFGHLYID